MMQLDDEYRLDSDGRYNWTLERRHVAGEDAKEPGKVAWKPVGHYPKVRQALSKYTDLRLKEQVGEREVDPSDFHEMIQRLEHTIEGAAKQIEGAMYA